MRKFASLVACVAMTATALVLGQAPAHAEQSVQSADNIAFSADDLPTWQANGVAWAVAAAGDKVVVGGSFSQLRPPDGTSGTAVNRRALAVLDAATGAPTNCVLDTALGGSTPTVRAALTAPDNRTVYIAGNFSSVGGVNVARVAAIDVPTCTVKPFRVSAISSTVWSLALHENTLYFGGMFSSVGGQTRMRYASVDATSGALKPFTVDIGLIDRPTGTVADGWAVAVSPDGSKVALSGEFDTVNGTESHAFAVVDAASGNTVRSYGGGFIPWTSVGKALVTNGDTLYGGNEGTGGGVFDGRFALDWNTLDQKWRDTCLGATQAVLVHNNVLYAANHAHDCGGINEFQDGKRVYLTAQDPTTMAHYGWVPALNDGIGEGIGPRALAVAKAVNGKEYFWVTGEFTRVNGKGQQSLTRFGPDDTGNPPATTPVAVPMDNGSIQVRIRSVVDTDDGVLTYRVFRNGSSTPIWEGTADSRWWSRPQLTFVDTTVTPGARYSYQVTVTDGINTSTRVGSATVTALGPRQSLSSATLAAKPSLYWNYDEASGTWVHDASGQTQSGKNGLALQGFTRSPGLGGGGNAIDFDGSTGYVWNDQYRPAPNTYSVSTWFKTTTTNGGKIVGYGNGRPRTDNGNTNTSGNYDRHLYMDNSGRLTFGIWVGYAATMTTPKAYNDGEWHQAVATQGPEGLRFYVDGVSVGSRGESIGQSYYGNWHVGGDSLGGWPNYPNSQFFAGSVDETAVFDRVLSRREVSDLYAAGGGAVDTNPVPASEYGAVVYAAEPEFYWPFDETSGSTTADASFFGTNDGTVGSQATLGAPGQIDGGRAVRTPGNDGGTVHAPQSNALRSFTLESWVKTTRGGKIIGYENSPTGFGGNYDKHVYMSDSGKITFGVWIGSAQIIQSGDGYNDDRWHHVVATQDSTGMKLFVDGVLQGTNPTTNSETGDGFWRIAGGNVGGWPDTPSNFFLDGSLDDVAVYGYALGADQIRQHYALGTNDRQAPTTPGQLTAAQQPSEVVLTWTASTDASGVAGYRVHRSTQSGFTPSGDTLIGESTSTTYTDASPEPGRYYYTVQALDNAGNVSGPATQVAVTVADITAPTAPSAVSVQMDGNTARVSWSGSTDDVAVTRYELHRGATADFLPSDTTLVGSTTGATTLTEQTVPRGTHFYKVVARDAAGNVSDASEAAQATVSDTSAPSKPGTVQTSTDGTTVNITWEASTDDTGVATYRVYRGTSAEFSPGENTLVGESTETRYTDQNLAAGQYWYRVVAVDGAGNASQPSDAVSARVADTTAPSKPGTVEAQVTGSSVQLTWPASTDDVGVSGYTVHRGSQADFTPSAGNQVASVAAATATQTGVPPGTYWYRVVARDEAGNQSPASESVRAVVASAPVQPVTVTVTPTMDAMVLQASASTNYGSNNQLSARGVGTSKIESYLEFDLPAAPEGMVLTGVTMRVRTSTDSTATSPDTQEFRLVEGSWTESSVTWTSRPAVGSASLGTLSGTTSLNTAYTTTLDPSALSTKVGQKVSLAMVSTGSDNVRLWSKESTTASYRPQLTLTYTQA